MTTNENIQVDLEKHYKPVWDCGLLGAGVVVAVLDSGAGPVTRNFAASTAKQGRPDIPFGRLETIEVPGASSGEWDGGLHAHEVMRRLLEVMRRLLMVAPAALLLDLPVFRPTCPAHTLIRAMEIATEHGADVINLSFGQPVPTALTEAHYTQCPLCHRAESLLDSDVLVVAAAGNWASEAFACPALAPKVLAMGAGLSAEEGEWYRRYPDKMLEDFLEGRASTSYATGMASAQLALFRSAFPSITAHAWVDIMRKKPTRYQRRPGFLAPLELFKYFLKISGGDYVSSVQWRELHRKGVASRRQLLTAIASKQADEFGGIPELAVTHRRRVDRFRSGIESYAAGLSSGDQRTTLKAAVNHFNLAAKEFRSLALPSMTAAALLSLGAALCFRARLDDQLIDTDCVDKAYEALSEALELLSANKGEEHAPLEGAVLSWRARILTLAAERKHGANDEAIGQATRAIAILAALPKTAATRKDLGHAQLHLARAYFFKAQVASWTRAKWLRRARSHAEQALATSGEVDFYTRSEGEWLVAQSI